LDNRENELWRLIRFTKDATPEQITAWCKKLNKLLIDRDIYGVVENGTVFNLTPEWMKAFEVERNGLEARNHSNRENKPP